MNLRFWRGRAKWADWWKSNSNMVGHEMYWELTIFTHVRHVDCLTWFELTVDTNKGGDHSPSFNFMFMILNWTIAEFHIYNAFHERQTD